MKTLELKDLKHYLGTGIMAKNTDASDKKGNEWMGIKEIIGLTEDSVIQMLNNFPYMIKFHISKIRPLLLPLSALTEPLSDGSIPAIKIAKIIANIHNDDLDDEWSIKNDGIILIKTPWDLRIEIFYKTDTICFAVYDTWNHRENRTIDQLKAFEYLYANHFWLGDQSLFETGEIIDKRTINK